MLETAHVAASDSFARFTPVCRNHVMSDNPGLDVRNQHVVLLVAGFQSSVNSSGARYYTGFLGSSPKPSKILYFR